MLLIAYMLIGFIPPLIAGPLAGLVFVDILKRGEKWLQIPFWILLIAVNLAIVYWIASESDEWFPILSFSACLFTPAASIVTLLLMRHAWRRLETAGRVAPTLRGWYVVGIVLIPILQLGMLAALWLLGPSLCKLGWMVCQDW